MSAAGEPEDDLLKLTDDLLEQTAALRRQWVELARSVGVAVPRASRTGADEDPDAAAGADESPAETIDPRRLVAVEMMIEGRSREEVESVLRAEFGDRAASEIAEEVYRGA